MTDTPPTSGGSPADRITQQLAQDARAMEARMLPAHGELNAQHIDHVRKKLAAFIERTGKSLPQVADMIGCRHGSLLKFTQDEHDGTQDDFCRRVDRVLTQLSHTGGATLPAQMVRTGVTDRVLGIIHQTNNLGSMSAVVGPSGVGKSTVFKAVAGFIIPGAVHIELSGVDASRSAVIQRIAAELGGPARYRMQASFNWIISHLQQTRRMLLLDEAHYLSEQALNTVRDIHKRTGCPIVFGGTQDLLSTIDDFTQFHGQFKRLVSLVYNITEEIIATGRPLYTVDEVRAYATEMGIRLSIGGAETATDIANTLGWGGFGALGYLLINAHTLMTRDAKRVVDENHINSALRQMEGASGFSRVKQRLDAPARKVKTA